MVYEIIANLLVPGSDGEPYKSWNMTDDFRVTARIMNLDTIDGFVHES